MHAVTWFTFVAREAFTQIVEMDPDTDVGQRGRALIVFGMCFLGARILESDD